MKLITKIIPKNLLSKFPKKIAKGSNISRSESNTTTSSSSSSKHDGPSTPTSILPEIPADAYFDLKQAFQMIDADGDGKIDRNDLESLIGRLGGSPPSPDELTAMLNEVDADGDGCVTLEEFYAVGSAFAPPSCDSEMRETFDFFDTDGDGKITAEELFNVFETIGNVDCTLEDCRRMIGGVDKNGDGFVCFEDFSKMMEMQQMRS